VTPDKRIVLNIAATYGRSLYGLILGLFSARWVLLSLGEIDYGLLGLVGGLVAFITFINSLMSDAVSRFYAFAVGEASTNATDGLDTCRRWFNTALAIHTTLPIFLLAGGYFFGFWLITTHLTIPPERMNACIWVWRFSCFSCFFSMISVPFRAMYVAKQEIAEMTVYIFGATTLNFLFLCYMITHPGEWLVRYSAWTCFIAILPLAVLDIRAIIAYPECRLRIRYLYDAARMKALFLFAAGRFACALALMLRDQASAILVNRVLGPAKNAVLQVGATVSNQTLTLTSAMQGAFNPAITNAYGAGNHALARALCLRFCKFGTLAILVFAVPLMLEAESVLRLWLKVPPPGSAALCTLLLIESIISRTVDGHWIIVFARGKMAAFNATECLGYFAAIGLFALFLSWNLGISSIGYALIACTLYTVPVKLFFARSLCGVSIRAWVRQIALPLLLVAVAGIAAGKAVCLMVEPSAVRIMLTTFACETILLTLTWILVLDGDEKSVILNRVRKWM